MAEVTRLLVEIDPTGAVVGGAIVDRSLTKVGITAKGATGSVIGLSGALGTFRKVAVGTLAALGPLAAVFGTIALATAAVNTIADFEEQLARLQGITNATAEDLQKFEDIARELGASTRFSATQAGQGLEFLALAGFKVDQAVAALPATLNLATVGQIELGQAADFASNILGQFSLTAEQTGRVVDTLTKTSQSSNTSVLQLAEAMKFAGTVAGSAGISIEETAAALGVLGDRGIQGAMAGTNLRQAILTLLDPTVEARAQLERMGIALKDIDPTSNSLIDIFSRLKDANLDLAAATQIFSSRTAASAITLVDSVDKIKELEAANREAAGSAQAFSDKLNDTLKGSVLGLRSALEELFIQAGDGGVLGALRNLTDFLTEFVRALGGGTSSIEGMNETIDTTLAILDELRVGFGETVDFVGNLIEDIANGVRDGFQRVTEIFSKTGSIIEETFGVPLVRIYDIAKDVANGVIATFRTVSQTLDIIGRGLVAGVTGYAEAARQALAGNVEEAAAFADQAALTINSAFIGAFSSAPTRFKKNFEEDLVGDAVSIGKQYAENFSAGLDALFSGDFEFARRVSDNVARRTGARVAADAERAAREAARDAAAAAAGVPTGSGAAADPRSDSRLRENFVTSSRTLRSLEDEARLIGLSNDARERAVQLAEFQSEAEKAFGEKLAENDPLLVQFTDRLREIQRVRELKEIFLEVRDAAASAFVEFATGAKTAQEALSEFLREIGKLLLQKAVTQLLDAFIFGGAGSTGGGLFSVVAGLTTRGGGGRAGGGPVDPSRSFTVGENGIERFRPNTSGFIEPNSNLTRDGGQMPPIDLKVINVNDPNEIASVLNSGRVDGAIINLMGRKAGEIRQRLEIA